jgi:SAM-dependent methyltransferase
MRPRPFRRLLRPAKHAAYLMRRRVDTLLARVPSLAAKERVYDSEFYAHSDAVHAPMYDRLAESIAARLEPASVLDVGCGTGRILARLAARGISVKGIEGSRHAVAASPVADVIVRSNLEHGVPEVGRFDLCMCIEVAEHLPARVAPTLVEGLTRASDRVLFTAAVPGQGGTHHVNEQPRSYWERMFADRGFELAPLGDAIRDDLRDIPEPAWMHENLMVFERRS